MQHVQLGCQCTYSTVQYSKKADAGMMGQRLCILAKSLASSYGNVEIGPRDVGVTSSLLIQVYRPFVLTSWQSGDGEISRGFDRTDHSYKLFFGYLLIC